MNSNNKKMSDLSVIILSVIATTTLAKAYLKTKARELRFARILSRKAKN